MSRAPNDRIQSDHAPEYYWLFQNRLERELAYWLSPEQVTETSFWLATVLSAVELMILFERDVIDFRIYFDEEKAVRRWRDVFLTVWDGDWQDKEQPGWRNYLYSKPEYRKQHRPAIVAMFDFLESVAHFWANISDRKEPVLAPLMPDYPLPYFSIRRWMNRANEEVVSVERVTQGMIEQLVKDIGSCSKCVKYYAFVGAFN